jgi:nicotinate-nucleotide adenylyltransferase
LVLAETAREACALDRVLFIPTHQPPHKDARSLLAGTTRLKLIQLAIRDHPGFAASDIELKRQGPSYSIETVRTLRRQLPSATLFLLIGQDMLAVPWVSWRELARLCTIVVAKRPGARGPKSERGIQWLQMPQLDIASSDIRRRLKAGRSIRYLVPAPVERYLKHHHLYRGGSV